MFRKSLDEHISEMRATASALTRYSYPKTSKIDELDITCLKQRSLCIDGYQVILFLSRSDHNDFFLDKLEIVGMTIPFIPTYIVCKIGAKVLGDKHLRYSESFKFGRKFYVWSVTLNKDEEPTESIDPEELTECEFEGFKYLYVDPFNNKC